MKRGLFIVLEGIDGAGTTTQINLLHDYIKTLSKYNDVLTTHEPWKSEEIKRKLKKDKDSYSDGLQMVSLYVDDRKNHLNELIIPNLNKGVYILSDRYNMSTYAYQMTQGVSFDEIDKIHNNRQITPPDLTFYLDVDFEIARERIINRGEKLEKFEKDKDFVIKLIDNYRKIVENNQADKSRFGDIIFIDGEKSIDEVADDILINFHRKYTLNSKF